MRFLSSIHFCLVLSAVAWTVSAPTSQAQEKRLTIGSTAPSLDIEHWIQDGNGFFKPVKSFEDGKVYVVEFWATWCPPCVQSMPHLAELQNQYRGQDVQIISITSEPLDTVDPFMEKDHPSGEKTVAEITSAYCLTSDPDESTYEDYMFAARQNGIPMAFLVGKTGEIEWIGHPMLIDEPLEQVVADSWDREAFKEEFNAQQRAKVLEMQLSKLFAAGKIDETIELLEQEIEQTKFEPLKESLIMLSYEIRYESDRIDDDVLAHYRERLEAAKQQPPLMRQLAISTITALERGSKLGEFASEVTTAYDASLGDLPEPMQIEGLQILSQIFLRQKNLESAIGAQSRAVDIASGKTKERLQQQLDRMQSLLKEDE